MKKIFNVFVVLCAVFAVCALMSCKQPTGPATVSEWKTAEFSTTGGTSFYSLIVYDDDTWEMSVTAKVSGISSTLDYAKGTFTGDMTKDTGPSNTVKAKITDTWDPDLEDWKPEPGTTEVDVTITGNGTKLRFSVYPEFTKQ